MVTAVSSFSRVSKRTLSKSSDFALLQFRVLRFGLLQDGDVEVGVFPEGEEVLVGRASLRRIPSQNRGTTQPEVRQRAYRAIQDKEAMIQNLLEICSRFFALA